MAYASNTYGKGIDIPAIDYTLTKPLNVLGAVSAGLGASNQIMDQPNTNRAREIVKNQQGLILGDKMKPTDIAVGPDGGLTSKMQDPLTYELARSLDSAKAQTESLQGANYQSQIDRRSALLPGEQEVLSGKAAELGGRTNLLDAKSKSILSPEVVETVTPSGKTLQVVTGPTGAKEVGKPGTAGFELPKGVQIGDKVLDSTGNETGMIYGPKGIVEDRSYVVAAQQQKLEDNKNKPSFTKGQEAADKYFTKDNDNFRTGGGAAGIESNLTRINDAVNTLNTPGKNISGPFLDFVPENVKAIVAPESRQVRQEMEQAVTATLRATLGAQFTENEGKRIFAYTFDPKASESVNAKKAQTLLTELQSAARQRIAANKYFEGNGTLKGFKLQPVTIAGKGYKSLSDLYNETGNTGKVIKATRAQAEEFGYDPNKKQHIMKNGDIIEITD